MLVTFDWALLSRIHITELDRKFFSKVFISSFMVNIDIIPIMHSDILFE